MLELENTIFTSVFVNKFSLDALLRCHPAGIFSSSLCSFVLLTLSIGINDYVLDSTSGTPGSGSSRKIAR